MKLKDVGTIIASREFTIKEGGKVTVIIGKPERIPASEDYYCPYQIRGLGDEKVSYSPGVDSVQALVLALTDIGSRLNASSPGKAGNLTWVGSHAPDYIGLPVADAIHDLILARPKA
jgi:hypothetical protein